MYDLFTSAHNAVFPMPMTTGVQISQNVVVSVRSNLPQKSSTVLSEPKFGPPQSNVPESTAEQGVTSQTEISHKSSGSTSCRGGVMPGLGST